MPPRLPEPLSRHPRPPNLSFPTMTTPAHQASAVVENPAYEGGVEPRVASAYRHPPLVDSSPYSATQMQQSALMSSGMDDKLVSGVPSQAAGVATHTIRCCFRCCRS